MGETRKYSIEIERQIAQEYLSGVSSSVLAEKYGFKTKKSITDKVKKFGLEVRSNRESKMIGKPYEDFSMLSIDSEFKAYYLGLLTSDGYIVKNTVGLDMTDEDVIKFISTTLNKRYLTILRDEPRQTRYRITLNNSRLVDELKRYGVVERKSKTL